MAKKSTKKTTTTKKEAPAKPAVEERMVGGILRKVDTATGDVLEDAKETILLDGQHVEVPDGKVWDTRLGCFMDKILYE
jgi:hypothetical protein